MLQKVRKQEIRFWDDGTFWHETIYKSLISTFGSFDASGFPKVGIKLLYINHLMPEFSLVPKSYSLFPYFLKLNPYLPFEF